MPMRLSEDMKKLFEEKKQAIIDKGVVWDPRVYFEFTYYYFPEIINKIDRLEIKYFDFVDDMLYRKRLYDLWYKERKTEKEIAEELKISVTCVAKRLEHSKKEVRKFFQLYKTYIKEQEEEKKMKKAVK